MPSRRGRVSDVALSAPEGVERRRIARHRQHLPQLLALEAEDEGLRDVEFVPLAPADGAVEGDDKLVTAPDVDNVRPVGAAGEFGRAPQEFEDLRPAAVLARHGASPGHAPDDAIADEAADGDRVALGEGPERVADAGDVIHARRFPRMRWDATSEGSIRAFKHRGVDPSLTGSNRRKARGSLSEELDHR